MTAVRPRSEPVFYVTVHAEGRAAERLDLSHRVISFVYEDSESKADKLVLTVDNWDLRNFDDPVWRKGNVLEVSWGYPGEMAPAREVVIQKVTGFQTLNVEAHAKSILMNKVSRCRTFEKHEALRRRAADRPRERIRAAAPGHSRHRDPPGRRHAGPADRRAVRATPRR